MLYLWSLCDYMPSGTKLPFFLQLYEWFFLAKFLGHFELSQSLTFPRTSLTAFGITKSWVYFPFRTRNDEWKYALGAMHLKLNEMRLFFMFVCMFFFLFFVFLVCFFLIFFGFSLSFVMIERVVQTAFFIHTRSVPLFVSLITFFSLF